MAVWCVLGVDTDTVRDREVLSVSTYGSSDASTSVSLSQLCWYDRVRSFVSRLQRPRLYSLGLGKQTKSSVNQTETNHVYNQRIGLL